MICDKCFYKIINSNKESRFCEVYSSFASSKKDCKYFTNFDYEEIRMDFLTALENLKEGFCESIELVDYSCIEYEPITIVITSYDLINLNSSSCLNINHFLSHDWKLKNIKNVFKEEERIKYVVNNCNKAFNTIGEAEAYCVANNYSYEEIIEMKGLIIKKKMPKMKKRMEITNTTGILPNNIKNAKVYAEWTE